MYNEVLEFQEGLSGEKVKTDYKIDRWLWKLKYSSNKLNDVGKLWVVCVKLISPRTMYSWIFFQLVHRLFFTFSRSTKKLANLSSPVCLGYSLVELLSNERHDGVDHLEGGDNTCVKEQ